MSRTESAPPPHDRGGDLPLSARDQVVPTPAHQFGAYDRKLVSLFEVIVAYFVGVFFNDIYHNAKAGLTKTSDGKSLTDIYKSRIQAFVIGAKNDEVCYRELITNLHKYFAVYYTTVSFPQFVDKVTTQVVPEEYYFQLSNNERDEFLSSTICDLVSGLAAFVTGPDLLSRIIDNHEHQWKVTQRMIQDHGISVLLAKRETLHNQFMKKIGQVSDSVPAAMVEQLKKALRRYVKEKTVEKVRADRLAAEVRELRTREAKYLKLIALFKAGGADAATATAAMAQHLMPRRDRLAEADGDAYDRPAPLPDENTLAEERRHGRSDSGSESGSRSDSRSGSDDSRDIRDDRRRGYKHRRGDSRKDRRTDDDNRPSRRDDDQRDDQRDDRRGDRHDHRRDDDRGKPRADDRGKPRADDRGKPRAADDRGKPRAADDCGKPRADDRKSRDDDRDDEESEPSDDSESDYDSTSERDSHDSDEPPVPRAALVPTGLKGGTSTDLLLGSAIMPVGTDDSIALDDSGEPVMMLPRRIVS